VQKWSELAEKEKGTKEIEGCLLNVNGSMIGIDNQSRRGIEKRREDMFQKGATAAIGDKMAVAAIKICKRCGRGRIHFRDKDRLAELLISLRHGVHGGINAKSF
jgi:hypothetical protein